MFDIAVFWPLCAHSWMPLLLKMGSTGGWMWRTCIDVHFTSWYFLLDCTRLWQHQTLKHVNLRGTPALEFSVLIIFAYMPYGLAEALKLSGRCLCLLELLAADTYLTALSPAINTNITWWTSIIRWMSWDKWSVCLVLNRTTLIFWPCFGGILFRWFWFFCLKSCVPCAFSVSFRYHGGLILWHCHVSLHTFQPVTGMPGQRSANIPQYSLHGRLVPSVLFGLNFSCKLAVCYVKCACKGHQESWGNSHCT